MTGRVFVVLLLLALAIPVVSKTGTSLQGVWRITESFRAPGEGTQEAPTTQPQPGYYVFTQRHYSVTKVTGERASAKRQGWTAT